MDEIPKNDEISCEICIVYYFVALNNIKNFRLRRLGLNVKFLEGKIPPFFKSKKITLLQGFGNRAVSPKILSQGFLGNPIPCCQRERNNWVSYKSQKSRFSVFGQMGA